MAKDYISFDMNGQRVGLKFGQSAMVQFDEKQNTLPVYIDVVKGGETIKTFSELGLAHLLYAAYVNNCYVKNVAASITFDYFFEFVETCTDKGQDYSNQVFLPIVNCFMEALNERLSKIRG